MDRQSEQFLHNKEEGMKPKLEEITVLKQSLAQEVEEKYNAYQRIMYFQTLYEEEKARANKQSIELEELKAFLRTSKDNTFNH